MIKAVLLDDEPLALRQLELYASKTEGMEVLEAIEKVPTDQYDRPLEDVRMLRVYRKD